MAMAQDVKHWNVLEFIGLCRSLQTSLQILGFYHGRLLRKNIFVARERHIFEG